MKWSAKSLVRHIDWECATLIVKNIFPWNLLTSCICSHAFYKQELEINSNADSKYCWWIKTNIHSNNTLKYNRNLKPSNPIATSIILLNFKAQTIFFPKKGNCVISINPNSKEQNTKGCSQYIKAERLYNFIFDYL